ncbi:MULTISPECIES: hypothetical protein [Xanthomonas]|uniref:hypothetical protein n=1 Tax=Xanthomonas TaxID=338 RepID=UPI001264825C|nr:MULTISPECIES: hypothetical protein [Xanthomonas]
MKTLPSSPPVPQKLQEILGEYPEKIQKLQNVLDNYCKNPNPLMPFDGAVWILQDTLGSFILEAREELKNAKAGGDPLVIENAKRKDFAVGSALFNMGGMPDLHAYFERNGGAL